MNNSHWSSSIGFEAIETYLLNKGGKVSDELMSDYLVDYDNFSSNNAYKVAYESFLTALSYQWLDDKLADEVCEKYDSDWFKYGYYLIGSFVNLNGRSVDVHSNPWFSSLDGYSHSLALTEYGLKGSLLEQYIIGLNGLNSTCAVSEILKGLLNGSEFSCYYDNLTGKTFLGFGDNSSYLEFDALGHVNAIISPSMHDGGISLGNFSFLQDSNIVIGLNNVLSYLNFNIGFYLGYMVTSNMFNDFASQLIMNYTTDMIIGTVGGMAIGLGVGLLITASAPISVPVIVGSSLLIFAGSYMVTYSNVHNDPTNPVKWAWNFADIGFSVITGGSVHPLIKIGVSSTDILVYDIISMIILKPIKETLKYLSIYFFEENLY